MFDLLPSDPAIPAPRLIVAGELFPNPNGAWHWPYLISTVVPGRVLREDAARLGEEGWRDVAIFLAGALRGIHALRPPADSPLDLTWAAFDTLMRQQWEGLAARHRAWGSLPATLIAQIEGWLPPLDDLVDHAMPPYVLHGDLHADHVFGGRNGKRWRGTGIIDFGDALTGDRAYDLVALHLGTFGGDRRWLRPFLAAYGFDSALRRDFARRQMAMTLLHEFNVLDRVMTHPELSWADSMDDLAAALWGVDSVRGT